MHLTQFFGVTKARWFIYANFFLNKSNSCLVCTNIFVTPQKKNIQWALTALLLCTRIVIIEQPFINDFVFLCSLRTIESLKCTKHLFKADIQPLARYLALDQGIYGHWKKLLTRTKRHPSARHSQCALNKYLVSRYYIFSAQYKHYCTKQSLCSALNTTLVCPQYPLSARQKQHQCTLIVKAAKTSMHLAQYLNITSYLQCTLTNLSVRSKQRSIAH